MNFYHSFDNFDHYEENLIAIMKQATIINNMFKNKSGIPFYEKKVKLCQALIANHLKNINIIHKMTDINVDLEAALEAFQNRSSDFFNSIEKELENQGTGHVKLSYDNLLDCFETIQRFLPSYVLKLHNIDRPLSN